MQFAGPVSSIRREQARLAVNLVREAVRNGPQSMAHALAFGSDHGPAHTDMPGVAHIWLSPKTIENIAEAERQKIGERIGLRPVRHHPGSLQF